MYNLKGNDLRSKQFLVQISPERSSTHKVKQMLLPAQPECDVKASRKKVNKTRLMY
jgi:hypothetical protein